MHNSNTFLVMIENCYISSNKDKYTNMRYMYNYNPYCVYELLLSKILSSIDSRTSTYLRSPKLAKIYILHIVFKNWIKIDSIIKE